MKENKEILEIKKKAAEFQAKGLYKKALEEIEKLLSYPEFLDEGIYQRIGELNKKLGNKGKALEYYMKAVEGYKKHSSYSHLIPLYKKILELDPKRKDLLIDLADAYYHRRMLTEASKTLYEYAGYLYQQGKIEESFGVYEKLMELAPENILLQREVAELYLLHDRTKEAWRIYRRIFEHYKKLGREDKLVEIKEKLEEIEIIIGDDLVELKGEEKEKKFDREDEEEKEFLTVEDILKGSETASFREIITKKAEAEPEEKMAVERGEIPSEDKEPEEREEIKKEIKKEETEEKIEEDVSEDKIDVVPKGWEQTVAMGDAYWELGEKEEALRIYYEAADECHKEHNFMDALKIYKKIADYYPFELKTRQKMVQIAQNLKDKNLLVESLLQLADCLYERSDKEKAKVWYLQILKRADPDCREAKEKLSIIAPELIEKIEKPRVTEKEVIEVPKKEKKAKAPGFPVKQKKEKVITTDKKEVTPEKETMLEEPEFIDLGEELRKELEKEEKEPQTKEEKEKEIFKQIEESIYTHAQKIDPVDALEVGMAMKELGLVEDAISNLKKALEGDHEVKKEAYHLLGQIFLEMGKPEIALENLENAIIIKIDDKEKDRAIHYDLARTYESINEWAKAVKHYKVIYEQDPSSKELKQKILELVKKIKLSQKSKD